MARLRKQSPEDSDDSLPDINELLGKQKQRVGSQEPKAGHTGRRVRNTSAETGSESVEALGEGLRKLGLNEERNPASARLIPKAQARETPVRRQRTLKTVSTNSVLLQKLSAVEISPEKKRNRKQQSEDVNTGLSKAKLPSRDASNAARQRRIVETDSEEEEDPVQVPKSVRRRRIIESDTEEESILCASGDSSYEEDSGNESEEKSRPVPREQSRDITPTVPAIPKTRQEEAPKDRKKHSRSTTPTGPVTNVATPSTSIRVPSFLPPLTKPSIPPQTTSERPSTSSSTTDNYAILHFSPPRARSPRKAPPTDRPSTPPPPTSPSKSRLVSPTKARPARIPTPPHNNRPSLDAFWSVELVNEWNDQYSPQKVLTSPKKSRFRGIGEGSDSYSDDSFPSPSTSPKKRNASPAKEARKERELREARKAFESQKQSLASSFLAELDATITAGQIGTLSASTGGVKLIWSKKLNTTAGRANWRREALRTRQSDDTVRTTHRHHASIELADKVIDDAARLRAVLAHEYCHLANFMVSGVRDNPHGASFKAWAAKVNAAFPDVTVTTKHSYAIAYKYIWTCEACGHEFKRHSRSIDPARHTCGACRGRLVQTKPAPRGGRADGKGGASEYQRFVKENFRGVKAELGDAGAMGSVMEELGRRYREMKLSKEKEAGKEGKGTKEGKEAQAKVREVVVLDED